eukprot:scaffold8522_cov157-Ochromonas_danica.AAC.6
MAAMTTDPGAVPKSARPLHDDSEELDYEQQENKSDHFKKFCRKCKGFKPLRAHHCSICGRCIVKMDHHCPWVNNCVGIGNHKLFLLFVLWVFLTCSYSMILVVAKYVSCSFGLTACGSPEDQLIVIFLVIVALLFGLFTLCMLGDQMTSIYTNQTQIDRLKNTKYAQQGEINEVCGSPSHINFHISWLWPIPVSFKNLDLEDRIYGFRRDEQEERAPLLAMVPISTAGSTPPCARSRKSASKSNLEDKDEQEKGEDKDQEGGKSVKDPCSSSGESVAGTVTEWLEDLNSIPSDGSLHGRDDDFAERLKLMTVPPLASKLDHQSPAPKSSQIFSGAATGSSSITGGESQIRKRLNGP